MTSLNLDEVSVLDQIVSSNGAWVSLVSLVPPAAVKNLLDLGFISLWCKDAFGRVLKGGPFVTLTPFGASARHVTLYERIEGYPRWIDTKRAARRESNHSPLREGRWAGIRSMSLPELIAVQDKREVYMSDDDGHVVYIFNGVPIKIDPRLSRYKHRASLVVFSERHQS